MKRFLALAFIFALALASGRAYATLTLYTTPWPGLGMFSGGASGTTTGAVTLVAAPASGHLYVTGIQCGRNDAGTTAITVTFNDAASSVMVLPNNGGGGGNNWSTGTGGPLQVATTTALTFTMSTNTSTVYCAAQGYVGP